MLGAQQPGSPAYHPSALSAHSEPKSLGGEPLPLSLLQAALPDGHSDGPRSTDHVLPWPHGSVVGSLLLGPHEAGFDVCVTLGPELNLSDFQTPYL